MSSTEEVFRNAAPAYNEALHSSGYGKNIEFVERNSERTNRKKRNRQRKVTWFNPPYSSNVKTNVGGKFLHLIVKHFPAGNKLHKIFNKNTVKVSYSCMKNIDSVIKSHNDRIIKKSKQTENPRERACNCRVKEDCPLRGECLANAIVYKATITHNDTVKFYFGLTGGPFKDRYRNHTKSFRHGKYENETELSKYIWGLKRKGVNYELRWDIIKRSNLKKRKSGMCNLCMEEKLIMATNKGNTINRRSELITKCRHNNRSKKPPDRSYPVHPPPQTKETNSQFA